jgi:hypothetical protein
MDQATHKNMHQAPTKSHSKPQKWKCCFESDLTVQKSQQEA